MSWISIEHLIYPRSDACLINAESWCGCRGLPFSILVRQDACCEQEVRRRIYIYKKINKHDANMLNVIDATDVWFAL